MKLFIFATLLMCAFGGEPCQPCLPSIRADPSDVNAPARYMPPDGFQLGALVEQDTAEYYGSDGSKCYQWSPHALQFNLERDPSSVPIDSTFDPAPGTVEYWNGDQSIDIWNNLRNLLDQDLYQLCFETNRDWTFEQLQQVPYGTYVENDNLDWTLTGHGQTILKGTLDYNADTGNTRLVVNTFDSNHENECRAGLPMYNAFPKIAENQLDDSIYPLSARTYVGVNLQEAPTDMVTEIVSYYYNGNIELMTGGSGGGILFYPQLLKDCQTVEECDSCEDVSESSDNGFVLIAIVVFAVLAFAFLTSRRRSN